jgi:hypothetical protein
MDRTVPRTGSEEIELYIRTYYSLLRSTAEVQVRTLEEVHAGMGSSLHPRAQSPDPDMSALIYASLRLPACLTVVDRVILGQSLEVFSQHGLADVEAWEPVAARARRRRSFFDRRSTLACIIASGSDIDDIVPILTGFQIEWNKMHRRLRGEQARAFLQAASDEEESLAALAAGIGIEAEDLDRLRRAWGGLFWDFMRAMAEAPKNLRVRLLAGSLNDYRRATQAWWEHVLAAEPSLARRPVYFVSSNPHSLVNLVSGFALRHEDELVRFLQSPGHASLLAEWQDIESRQVRSNRENFLYYALKKCLETPEGRGLKAARLADEQACGIRRFASHGFDVTVQLLELRRLRTDWLDPRLQSPQLAALAESEAMIVNIDYPLGAAAYLILSYLATRVGEIRGVYATGKAATLNGVIGDVMIPGVVHDEHSQNTYLLSNCFAASDISDDLVYGTVLDNQKTVSVRGTFLQTPRYMDVFYREGYTDIEMEAGPYLSAVSEMVRPRRHPNNEIVNLYTAPFDIGLLHYASDTPLGKGRNLGAGSLSYFGMDPTYATSLAIVRRILQQEIRRLQAEAA